MAGVPAEKKASGCSTRVRHLLGFQKEKFFRLDNFNARRRVAILANENAALFCFGHDI